METLVSLKIQDTAIRYNILQQIGSGGQGAVYLAEDLKDPDLRFVALKQQELDLMLGRIKNSILRQHQCLYCQLCTRCKHCQKCDSCKHKPHTIHQSKQLEESAHEAKGLLSRELLRLLREISSIQLKHLNIVTIYESYISTDNKFIIISEFAPQDLEKFVERRFQIQQQLTNHEISMILLQILNGLEYIHAQNFIHRDISPQNILVFKDQIIKICDFGFVSYGDQTNANIGKQEYMAPEVNYGNQNYNNAIDIWSLGITLYYICTGSIIFKGESVNYLAKDQKRIELPAEHSQFQEMLEQMIQINPDNRPTATQLKEDLMKFIDENNSDLKKYKNLLLLHLTNQHKVIISKQGEIYEKQIQRYFKQETIRQEATSHEDKILFDQ
ncbi:camk family protein kinase [Stylonychia lemnae]|uniref:Camk family protein kinase n=1 Tax=Stylonychia lemnae TaxID=5949 RepID=A0A077ZZ41_STYLE|nr:camk family protein kinase [Stylonychia lemnae]|eukprot:CDW74837.1 camk family protein kinase [Stylonychia lemnae]